MDSIIKEMEDLAKAGYKEVTLLGQNIDAYGRDMSPKRKFADLLACVGRSGSAETACVAPPIEPALQPRPIFRLQGRS